MGKQVFIVAFALVLAFVTAFCLVASVGRALRRARARRAAYVVEDASAGASGAGLAGFGVGAGAGSLGSTDGAGGSSVGTPAGAGGADAAAQASDAKMGYSARSGTYAHLVRNGIPLFTGIARLFLRVKFADDFVRNLAAWMRTRGYATKKDALASLLLGVLLGAGLLSAAVARNFVALIAAPALIVTALVLRMQSARDSQDDALREGVPGALSVMSECFQSGYSLVQTLQMVADQSSAKLSQVFGKCASMLQLGASSGEALAALRTETNVSELSFVAVALDVQHQTGGSIASVLGAAEQMVQDKIDLRRSLRVQTAQAKLSARVVCLMPFILAFVLSLVSDGFMAPFFSSPAGLVMLCVALLMEAAGVVMVRKMLKTAL